MSTSETSLVDDHSCEYPDLVADLGQQWSTHCAKCNSLNPTNGATAALLVQARDEIIRLRAEVMRLRVRNVYLEDENDDLHDDVMRLLREIGEARATSTTSTPEVDHG